MTPTPARRAPDPILPESLRSSSRVIHSQLEFKFWLLKHPTVEEVRPSICVTCGGAAREPGRALGIVGHGVRDRQQRGPVSGDGPPTELVIPVRRYRCRRCAAVLTVVPSEVAPRRHYSRPAIAVALARLGLLGETAATVRRAVGTWAADAMVGWRTLRRWVAAVRAGVLFERARLSSKASDRAVAARVAQHALGAAPPTLRDEPMLLQVFAGAIAMA